MRQFVRVVMLSVFLCLGIAVASQPLVLSGGLAYADEGGGEE